MTVFTREREGLISPPVEMMTKDQIRKAIAQRDALEAKLRAADRELIQMGRQFWQDQGLCSFPRVEALRRAVL